MTVVVVVVVVLILSGWLYLPEGRFTYRSSVQKNTTMIQTTTKVPSKTILGAAPLLPFLTSNETTSVKIPITYGYNNRRKQIFNLHTRFLASLKLRITCGL